MSHSSHDHSPKTDPQPKQALLDAAESLFSQKGTDGVSLRELTQAAGVNLASVSYYFGSKENLFAEVIARRIRPINARRLEALQAVLDKAGEGSPRLEDILEAFVRPFFEAGLKSEKDDVLGRLLVRLFTEADGVTVPLFEQELLPVARQFAMAIMRARPDFPVRHVFFAQVFFAGAMINVFASRKRFQSLSAVIGGLPGNEEVLQALVRYGVAGFHGLRTPATAPTNPPPPA